VFWLALSLQNPEKKISKNITNIREAQKLVIHTLARKWYDHTAPYLGVLQLVLL